MARLAPQAILVVASLLGAGCSSDVVGPIDASVDGGPTSDDGGPDAGPRDGGTDGGTTDASVDAPTARCTVGEDRVLLRAEGPRETQVLTRGDEALLISSGAGLLGVRRAASGVLSPTITYAEVGLYRPARAVWDGETLTVVASGPPEVLDFDGEGTLSRRRDFGAFISTRNGSRPTPTFVDGGLAVAYSRDDSVDTGIVGAEVWLAREGAESLVHERVATTADTWAHTTALLNDGATTPVLAWVSWRSIGLVEVPSAGAPIEQPLEAVSSGAVVARQGERLWVAVAPLTEGDDSSVFVLSIADGAELARADIPGRVLSMLVDGGEAHLLVTESGRLEHRLVSSSLSPIEATELHVGGAPGQSSLGLLADGTLLALYGTGTDTTATDDDEIHLATLTCR